MALRLGNADILLHILLHFAVIISFEDNYYVFQLYIISNDVVWSLMYVQFFITTVPCPWLDGRHVVFGEVTDGYDVIKEVEGFGSDSGKTKAPIVIADCGEIA